VKNHSTNHENTTNVGSSQNEVTIQTPLIKKYRQKKYTFLIGLWLIWHTTIWVLWKARNDKIFKGITRDTEELVKRLRFNPGDGCYKN